MKNHLRYFIAITFLACYISGYSQQKIFVVTKTISKDYETANIPEVQIKGEKSDITIRRWENKSVKIEIQLIARNPKRAKAEQDLQFINQCRLIKKMILQFLFAL